MCIARDEWMDRCGRLYECVHTCVLTHVANCMNEWMSEWVEEICV